MTVSADYSEDGKSLTIHINNRFDFNVHKDFRDAYERVADRNIEFIVDMAGTDYMDSSALGMLLLLREFAGGDKANVRIINCNSDLQSILSISNFQHLFKIS